MDDDTDQDEEVGYGKPPKHSRFKKGMSGNPKGRPPKVRNTAGQTRIEQLMASKCATIQIDGKQRQITAQEVLYRRLALGARKGNISDARAILKARRDLIKALLTELGQTVGGGPRETGPSLLMPEKPSPEEWEEEAMEQQEKLYRETQDSFRDEP